MKPLILHIIIFLSFLQNANSQINCVLDSTKRQRITTPNLHNAYTCYMEMTRGKTPRWGTGFLIHPRVLLTAGHNFAWYPTGSVNTVKLYFGSIDSVTYLASDTISLVDGVNKFYNSGYWLNGKVKNDYSIIILPDSTLYKKIGGCYSLNPIIRTEKIPTPVHITGSPGGKALFEIWTDSTNSVENNGSYIRYDLFTAARNSGSPIWIKTQNGYQVIGIHSRSYGNCNAAVLINQDVINQIKEWCSKANVKF